MKIETVKEKNVPVSIQSRRNPFLSMQKELDNAMNYFDRWFGFPSFSRREFENLTLMPATDIVEDDENFKAEVEIPGMGVEDIKVSIEDGILTIKGEKTVSRKDKGKSYKMREISYGGYERSIALPNSLDTEKAKASFKKGMLWVTIPKKLESAKKPKEITVEKV